MTAATGAEARVVERLRPLRWRLLLLAVLVGGVALLHRVDSLLSREYVREAATQAVQTDALLESFVLQRVELLQGLRTLTVTMPPAEARRRFELFARDVVGHTPDLLMVGLLDTAGVVQARYLRPGLPATRLQNHRAVSARARALDVAAREQQPAVSETVVLPGGVPGTVVYVPVVRSGALEGFVAGSIPYDALLRSALGDRLLDRFSYRVRDGAGVVIASSAAYPSQPGRLELREVQLPGNRRWRLEVAIPPFQPYTARLANWVAGLLALALVAGFMLREEARARRFDAHSRNLELLSRDLLDANVRLEEHAQQIAQANRAKSRFLANVSHELRTPLNAILGYNALALEGMYGTLQGPLHEAHARIRVAAEHLLALVNDVLDLSKIEVGRMELELGTVDLVALADGVVTVLEPIAQAKGLRVDVVAGRDACTVVTDARHVRQVLLNLISNAIKFTERGTVTVFVCRPPDAPPKHVAVAVQDSGIGIAHEDLGRIFEEFEQVRPSGRGDSIQRGTGLGLAIARKLSRLLGGDLTVESSPGEGSRFTLLLPPRAPDALAETSREVEIIGPRREEREVAIQMHDDMPQRPPGRNILASDAAAERQNDVPLIPLDDAGDGSYGLDARGVGD